MIKGWAFARTLALAGFFTFFFFGKFVILGGEGHEPEMAVDFLTMGMSRLSTFLGICLGSVLGCALMYYGSEWIKPYLDPKNPLQAIGGIAVIVALILLFNYRYRQMKRKAGH